MLNNEMMKVCGRKEEEKRRKKAMMSGKKDQLEEDEKNDFRCNIMIDNGQGTMGDDV
jgi:hypothetical protein